MNPNRFIRKIAIFVVVFSMLLTNFTVGVKQNVARADGPTQITTWTELNAVRDNLLGDYILMNDLDETTEGYATYASSTANAGAGWDPIGTTGADNRFTGSFDGNNHTISGLYIYRPATDIVGLFGYVSDADLNNIILENVNIVGHGYVGSLVGYNLNSSISTSSASSGDITGIADYTGGLVGGNYGSISNSYFIGSVFASGDFVGGLIGYSDNGSISNSYSAGSVSASNRVGGLVGHNNNNSSISNSYSMAAVLGGWYVGGLVGLNYGPISKSYSAGSVLASVNYDGGLVGNNISGSTNYSFWDINTSGQETSVGGTGKTTEEMKTLTTFTTELGENSWDFADTWAMGNGRNSGYAYLQSIPPEALTHTLTYTALDNGSITGDSPQTVEDGADGSEVTAVPDTGYSFVSWSDDSTSTSRTDTNITTSTVYTATFAINTYTLSYTAGTGGSITGSSSQTVNYGSDGSGVTAVANSGYTFSQWSDGTTNNPRTDTSISENISVSAVFTANPSSGGGFTPPSTPKVVISPSFSDGSVNSSVTNVYQMAVSDNEDFSGVSWEDYNESYKTSNKTLYIKFRSKDGGVSEVYTVESQKSKAESSDKTDGSTPDEIKNITCQSNFTRNLSSGMTGSDVKELQQYLNNNGFIIALSGNGSKDSETNYFGNLTKQALIKFQQAKQLNETGILDLATREYIDCKTETSPTIEKPQITTKNTYNFTRDLEFGFAGEDVRELQKYLNNNSFVLSPAGQPGSSGNETTVFGHATKNALIKFQQSINLPAYGYFGPMTRNVLNQ